MDVNDLRAVITVASFAAFIGIVWWAYAGGRRSGFDRAARRILDEDEDTEEARGEGR